MKIGQKQKEMIVGGALHEAPSFLLHPVNLSKYFSYYQSIYLLMLYQHILIVHDNGFHCDIFTHKYNEFQSYSPLNLLLCCLMPF